MEKRPFETLGYLMPGDGDPSQNEGEHLEETKKERECTVIGGLGNELGDFGNGHKEERWENINPEDSFPIVMSAVELDNTPKNYLPKEDDDLFLSLSLRPNGSSVTCPTVTENLSHVTGDDCSGTKAESILKKYASAVLDVQDRVSKTPCSFVQKRETVPRLKSPEQNNSVLSVWTLNFR